MTHAPSLDAPSTLYRRLLGSSWDELSEPVRLAHATRSTVRGSGRLLVCHGRGRVARWIARVLRLPRASAAADTRLVVTPRSDGERWCRSFDGRHFDTWQYQAGERELAERVGLLEFRFELQAMKGSLLFRSVGAAFVWRWIRLPLPATWAPRVDAREDPAGAQRIRVHVSVAVPGVGPVLAYDGFIDIERSPA